MYASQRTKNNKIKKSKRTKQKQHNNPTFDSFTEVPLCDIQHNTTHDTNNNHKLIKVGKTLMDLSPHLPDRQLSSTNNRYNKDNIRLSRRTTPPGSIIKLRKQGKLRTVPKVYDNEYHPRLAYLLVSELGANKHQLGKIFGVSYKTINQWIYRFPKFKKQLIKGRDYYNAVSVEFSLTKRATGYNVETISTQDETTTDINGRTSTKSVEKKDIKHIPADTRAIEFYLSNRMNKRWNKQMKIETQGKVDHKHNHEYTVEEDLKKSLTSETAMDVFKTLAKSGAINTTEFSTDTKH